MQLPNRPIRTALALAVCQLLLACAQPAKNNFVSHFRTDLSQGDYVFLPDGEEQAGKKSDDSAQSQQPRILEGTGKLLGEAKTFPPVTGRLSSSTSKMLRWPKWCVPCWETFLAWTTCFTPDCGKCHAEHSQQYSCRPGAESAGDRIAGQRHGHGSRCARHLPCRPCRRPQNIGATVRQATTSTPLAPGCRTIIVPLQYIGANEMAAILRPMVPGDAIVRVDNIRNLLVMAGSRAQAEGWLDMVRTFDVNLLEGMSVGVFPLKYVSIQEVSAALQLMNGGAAVQQRLQPRVRPGQAPVVLRVRHLRRMRQRGCSAYGSQPLVRRAAHHAH